MKVTHLQVKVNGQSKYYTMACLNSVPGYQCQAINVGFELYIGIESKLLISIIGFDLELGEFCHDFHSISIPINHSGTHFNLPAISTSLK